MRKGSFKELLQFQLKLKFYKISPYTHASLKEQQSSSILSGKFFKKINVPLF